MFAQFNSYESPNTPIPSNSSNSSNSPNVPVPVDIKDDVVSIIYSVVNNKQHTLYNFNDKNISYVIPFTSNLNVFKEQVKLNLFDQMQMNDDNNEKKYIETIVCDNMFYSIINKEDDILKLNIDIFKYNYDMLTFLKKIYPECGFLFIKTTKKNVEILVSQDLINNELFIPFVSLIELNKLERYLYDISNKTKRLYLTPTLIYTAQGELCKINDSHDSSTIHKNLEPMNFVDFDLKNAEKILLNASIGFHGLNQNQISKFEKIVKEGYDDSFEKYMSDAEKERKNAYEFLQTIKTKEYFKSKIIDINKSLSRLGIFNRLGRVGTIGLPDRVGLLGRRGGERRKIAVSNGVVKYDDHITDDTDYTDYTDDTDDNMNDDIGKNDKNDKKIDGIDDETFTIEFNNFLKLMFDVNKILKIKDKKALNKPILSTFDVNKYLENTYGIVKQKDSIVKFFVNLFKSNTDNKLYMFNVSASFKPEDIKL